MLTNLPKIAALPRPAADSESGLPGFATGIAQIAGEIAPGVNLQARCRIGMQVGYQF
jgi:hypothetical protein